MRKERKRKTKKAKPKTNKVIGKRHTGCLRHVPYRIFFERLATDRDRFCCAVKGATYAMEIPSKSSRLESSNKLAF